MAEQLQHILDRIPDTEEVQSRLAANLREAAFLRSLLRLAKHKDKARQHQNIQKEASLAS